VAVKRFLFWLIKSLSGSPVFLKNPYTAQKKLGRSGREGPHGEIIFTE
jgi:hypothetical protein